jgi:SAM-dependent methyltransferase
MSSSDNRAPQRSDNGLPPQSTTVSADSEGIRVRSWGRTDFEKIQSLAADQSNFTIPSRYQLDMLHYGEPGLNLVAYTADDKILGYLLSLWSHPGELFLWQIARDRKTPELQRLSGNGVQRLLEEFAKNVKRSGASALQFTIASDTIARWVRRLTPQLFGRELRELCFKVEGERAYEIRFLPIPQQLTDVYEIPGFAEFVQRVFSVDKISEDWLHTIRDFSSDDSILEVGAGDGRLTAHLLNTGANVIAVEPNLSFDPQKGCVTGSPSDEQLRVLRGYFPNIPTEKCSCIILHQNVFTELANQMDEGDLIAALKSHLRPGGRLIFDFVSDLNPGPIGSAQEVFRGKVQGLGDVVYEREFLGRHWGMRYETVLRFSFEKDGKRELHSRRIEARFPLLDQIQRQIGSQGGESSAHAIRAFTFFPGQSQIVQAKFLQ